jgi:hypothetical protein
MNPEFIFTIVSLQVCVCMFASADADDVSDTHASRARWIFAGDFVRCQNCLHEIGFRQRSSSGPGACLVYVRLFFDASYVK